MLVENKDAKDLNSVVDDVGRVDVTSAADVLAGADFTTVTRNTFYGTPVSVPLPKLVV